VVQSNYAFNLPVNAGINLRQSSTNTVFNNFIAGSPGANTAGGIFQQTTSGNRIFQNTLSNLNIGLYAYADTASSSYFLNRNLTSMTHFVFSPAALALDGGASFGGNYWAGHNPATPYSKFIYNSGGSMNGPYKDNYPAADDTLNKTSYVNVLYPVAGTHASAGSRKTIEWRSAGCTYMDIYYQSAATGLVSIFSNYPDVGVFNWTVPSLPAGTDYTIYLDCKNSTNQSRGINGRSGAFQITAAGLELLTPQGNERLTAGSQTTVAWKQTPSVPSVDILYRSGTGAFTTVLLSNVTRDAASVTVPADATSRGSFLVRASNNHGIADSTDGFVNIRSASAPQITAPTETLQIGTLHQVEWTSPPSSLYVDVQYLNTVTSTYVPLVQNLPDFGRFTFLVPEQTMTGTKLRVQFKSTASTIITASDSGTFNTSPTGGAAPPPPPPPPPATGTPEVIGLSPLSGSATSGVFSATYNHPNGVNGHYLGYILFLPTPNVVNYVATGSCLVEYNRISNGMRLINDAGTGWLGGESGVPVGASGTTLSNAYCSLDTRQSGAQLSGTQMTVNAKVTFKAALKGMLGTFLQELDVNGVWTGMTQFGNWQAYSVSTPKPGPYLTGGGPATGAGSSATFSIGAGHTSGVNTLSMVHLLISSKIVGAPVCQVVYFPVANTVYLINDTGSDLVPGSLTPGTNTGTLANSRCTVSGTGMTRSTSGNTRTLTLPVSFNPGTFGGAKSVYVNAFDNYGLLTHWQKIGAWTVQ